MITERTYRRMIAGSETVNQLNRLHINLERRLLPAERQVLLESIREDAGFWGNWIIRAWPLRSLVRKVLGSIAGKTAVELELLNWGMRWAERSKKLPPCEGDLWKRTKVTRGYGLFQRSEHPSRRLLIGWTGSTSLMMLPTPDFLRAMSFIDADVLMLWPGATRRFLEGIPGLGRTFDESVDGLVKMVDSWGYDEHITMGVSGGALPALGASIALKATHAYLLGPLDPLQKSPYRWKDFVETVSIRADGIPHIVVAAGEESANDVAHARKIAHDCSATVVLVPGASHGILYSLFQTGDLVSWLTGFFGRVGAYTSSRPEATWVAPN